MKILIYFLLLLPGVYLGNTAIMSHDEYLKKNFDSKSYGDGVTPQRLDNLKGNIKILSAFTYDVNEDSTKGTLTQGTQTFTYVFNNDKYIVEEWSYDESKQVLSKSFYRDFKRFQKDSFIVYENNKVVVGEWTDYNQEGLKIKEISDYHGKMQELHFEIKKVGDTIYHYNKYTVDTYHNNRLKQEKQHNGFRISDFEYYPDGSLKSANHHGMGGISYSEVFNPAGYLIKLQFFQYTEGKLSETTTRLIKYDHNNLAIEEIKVHESENSTYQDTLTYKYRNNKLETVFEDGRAIGQCLYNEYGDMTLRTYKFDKETFVYFDYDANNNWRKKIMYSNNKPLYITEREIVYY